MDIDKLQQLFPKGRLSNSSEGLAEELNFPLTNGYFHLPKDSLSEREAQLLEIFLPIAPRSATAKEHLYYQVLFEKAPAPKTPPLRIIQIKLRTRDNFLQKEWLSEIQDMFLKLADSFFLTEDLLLLVEEKDETNYPVEEIFGLFQALDNDFEISTQVFVGAFHQDLSRLADNFKEEQQIFQKELAHHTGQRNFSFTSTAINYFVATAMKESPLMNSLYQDWFSDSEIRSILAALWQNQGNVSSAAKELFLHRNTLIYRIDKFQEATRLDVKNMDDLVFCHLMIKIFSE